MASIVAGEAIRGSWWSHPRSHEIFAVLNCLADRSDVLLVKLLRGKVTLVHKRLWSALIGVAISREPWQLARLSSTAADLLEHLDGEGQLIPATPRDRTLTQAIRQLESRLLIHAAQEHTSTGQHQRILMSWDHWRMTTQFTDPPLEIDDARASLESATQSLTTASSDNLLPWQSG